MPTTPHFDLIQLNDEIRIQIRAARMATLAKLLSTITFFIWVVGVALLIGAKSTSRPYPISVWPLGIWVAAGALLFGILVFHFTFQETIRVGREAIQIDYQVWTFWKWSYSYLAKHVHVLRLSSLLPATIWSPRIDLEYDGKTVSFGSRVNEFQARRILSEIQKKFDHYNVRI